MDIDDDTANLTDALHINTATADDLIAELRRVIDELYALRIAVIALGSKP